MRAVVWRVKSASCTVEGRTTGKIDNGLMVFLGVGQEDSQKDAEILAKKIAFMRIFCDENGKKNLSVLDVDGRALVISNFTLYADCTHGRRPNYMFAGAPDIANELYEYFCKCLENNGIPDIQKGVFGAAMTLDPICDGPVTIILDSKDFM